MTRLPPDVTAAMLQPEFWLDRLPDPDALLMDSGMVEAFNARVHRVLKIPPVLDLPDTLPRAEVEAHMAAYLPDHPLYATDGRQAPLARFEHYLKAAHPASDPVAVRFGLATQRTDVRAFPTSAVFTRDPFDFAFDRLQETTLDAGWPVAILADDGRGTGWLFCLTPHYWGWVRAAHIAIGTRTEVARYHSGGSHFVVTVAARGLVVRGDDGAGITPQMGTRLPLPEGEEDADCWRLQLPVRAPQDGSLGLCEGVAPKRGGDFHPGYLPPTQRTLFTQAFALWGEPYAWGGSRLGIFGRDCSRLIRDVYATAGILLPRNGEQQQRVCTVQGAFAPDMPGPQRSTLLCDQASPGAILVLPGHVMLYLGCLAGKPYALHATAASPYHQVIVSDLSLGSDSASGSLLMRLTHVVTPGSDGGEL